MQSPINTTQRISMTKYAVIMTCLALVSGTMMAKSGGKGGKSGKSGGGRDGSSQNSARHPREAQSSGSQQSGSAAYYDTSSETSPRSGAGTSRETKDSFISEPRGAATSQTVGIITVQGVVNSAEERQQIVQQLKQIQGVKSVINRIHISDESRSGPTSGTTGAVSGRQGAGAASQGTSTQP